MSTNTKYCNNKFNSLAAKSLMEDFSYRSTAGMTTAYAMVDSYPTFTEMDMTKKEEKVLESLLEENIDEDNNVMRVPSKNFKIIWEGTELLIHKLDCGRFNIQGLKVNMDGKEELLQEKSSFSNIQR